jgi:peptidoglycan/LPS O-acetylase OafA/YrhL
MNYKKINQTFPALTGVRAIAAYMVFFHHYIGQCFDGIFLPIVKEFYTGVTIFFVLSGFLIYYKYSGLVKLEREFLLNYFRNRFARIYPVYFFMVVLSAWAFAHNLGNGGIKNQALLIGLQLTFIRGFFDYYKFIGVGQGWTLTVEESFYFLFPLLVLIIKKWGFGRSLLSIYLIGAILTGIGAIIQFYGFFFPVNFVINYTFLGRAAEFFFGMYLAKIVLLQELHQQNGRIPKYTLLGLAGITTSLFFMSRISESCTYGTFYPGGMIINNLLLPIFICILFYGLINESSMVQRFLGSRPMVLLGKSSYAFYLIHVGVFQFILQKFVSPNLWVIFFLMIILSIIVYLAIEEPARRLIRQIQFQKQ